MQAIIKKRHSAAYTSYFSQAWNLVRVYNEDKQAVYISKILEQNLLEQIYSPWQK